MDKINFEDLPSTNTPINAENLNKVQDNIEEAIPAVIDNLESDSSTSALSAKQGKILNEKIEKARITVLHESIDSKGVFTLADNVNNYDEIRVSATLNAYNHRIMCNTYMSFLYSDFVHTLQYSPTEHDDSLKIYNNTIDTSLCEKIGVDNRHIYRVFGIKY